jgi:hypothetical protein
MEAPDEVDSGTEGLRRQAEALAARSSRLVAAARGLSAKAEELRRAVLELESRRKQRATRERGAPAIPGHRPTAPPSHG